MISEPKQFSDKFNLLPEEVQFYFSNNFSGNLIISLASEYKVDADFVYGLVFDAVNHDFDFEYLHDEVKKLDITGIAQNNFFRDFIGKILLPIGGYIKNADIKGALIKNGGDAKIYEKNVKDFLSLIEEENLKSVDSLIELHEKTVDPKEEKTYTFDLILNHLLDVLNYNTPEATATLNGGLVYLLYNDSNFKIDATRILLENSEHLGSSPLVIEEKEVTPTISNWIKDFIKENGSDIFDEITLAQYLSTSRNAKKLNQVDKDVLRKLLKFYRNLSFFPESMANLAPEEWQIVPFDKPEGAPHEFKDALSDDVPVRKNEPKFEPKKVEQKKVEPKIAAKKMETKIEAPKEISPLDELNQALSQYAPGSLEYKTIAQEIEHLKRKKL